MKRQPILPVLPVLWLLAVCTGCNSPVLQPFQSSGALVIDQEPFTRQIQIADNIKTVEIQHEGGNLTVMGWDQPYMLVEGIKQAAAETVEDAKAILYSIDLSAYESPINRLVIEYQDSQGFSWLKKPAGRIDYTAKVPRGITLELKVKRGSVTVSDAESDVWITHETGDVTAEKIRANLDIKSTGNSSAGNLVRIRDIRYNVRTETKDNRLEVEQIGGNADITHRNGECRIRQIGRDVSFQGNEASLMLQDVKGYINLDNRRGDVTCELFYDGIRAGVTGGSLRLEPQTPITRGFECKVDTGNLVLRVPESASMIVEIQAVDGSIHSDFPMPVRAEGNVSYANGSINSGATLVRLEVRRGVASLLKTNPVLPAAPAPASLAPANPVPPAPLIPASDLEPSAPSSSRKGAEIKPAALPLKPGS